MIAYVGQTRSRALVTTLNQHDIGATAIDSCLPLRAGEHVAAFLVALEACATETELTHGITSG